MVDDWKDGASVFVCVCVILCWKGCVAVWSLLADYNQMTCAVLNSSSVCLFIVAVLSLEAVCVFLWKLDIGR